MNKYVIYQDEDAIARLANRFEPYDFYDEIENATSALSIDIERKIAFALCNYDPHSLYGDYLVIDESEDAILVKFQWITAFDDNEYYSEVIYLPNADRVILLSDSTGDMPHSLKEVGHYNWITPNGRICVNINGMPKPI